MKDEIRRMLPFAGIQIGVWVELVKQERVSQVEVRVGGIGGRRVLAVGARGHVEQPVGQVHVDCALQRVDFCRICGAMICSQTVNG